MLQTLTKSKFLRKDAIKLPKLWEKVIFSVGFLVSQIPRQSAKAETENTQHLFF